MVEFNEYRTMNRKQDLRLETAMLVGQIVDLLSWLHMKRAFSQLQMMAVIAPRYALALALGYLTFFYHGPALIFPLFQRNVGSFRYSPWSSREYGKEDGLPGAEQMLSKALLTAKGLYSNINSHFFLTAL
jgi:hypothetical protein